MSQDRQCNKIPLTAWRSWVTVMPRIFQQGARSDKLRQHTGGTSKAVIAQPCVSTAAGCGIANPWIRPGRTIVIGQNNRWRHAMRQRRSTRLQIHWRDEPVGQFAQLSAH